MTRERGGLWLGLARAVFYPAARALARYRTEGLERIPEQGAALVVGNHISYLDPLYTAVFVNLRGRIPRFLAKHSLWKVPILRRVLDGTGQIPVHRDSADAQHSLHSGIQALADGKVVLIYPEGTITRDPDGWPMRSHTGVARLALAADVPVVPLVHWGTREIYDRYRRRFRPLPRKDVVVRAGAPVDLSEFRGRHVDGPLLRAVTDRVMDAVRHELAAVRGEPAPAEFYRRPRERDRPGRASGEVA